MVLNKDFELFEVANEFLAVPLGRSADGFGGVVILSAIAYRVLSLLKEDHSREELLSYITDHYDVEYQEAANDLDNLIHDCMEMGLVIV